MPAGHITAVVYSTASGRIRRLIDIGVCTDPVAAARGITLMPGESFHAHVSPGDGWHAEEEIQSHLTVHVTGGRHPVHLAHPVMAAIHAKHASKGAAAPTLTPVLDRYVEVDASGNVLSVYFCNQEDPPPNGGTLLAHETADTRWKYVWATGVWVSP